MFVQVIQGKVSDAGAARARFDKWMTDLGPGATGWLGSTAGVTDDGRLVVLARFESKEAAQQNSERPEQSAWWEETQKVFDGEPEFHDSTSAEADLSGNPDDAGFVQIMQGRTTDPDKARQLMADDTIDWESYRPEILGSLNLEHDGDGWTMVTYFSSEEAAREGERKPPPPEMEKLMQELMAISAGEPTYFDLKDPWLDSPG